MAAVLGVIASVSVSVNVSATISSGFVPSGVENNILKEREMAPKCMSKTQRLENQRAYGDKIGDQSVMEQKATRAKFGNYCRAKARGVNSIKHIIYMAAVLGVIASVLVSVNVRDHSILIAHSWGRYEW